MSNFTKNITGSYTDEYDINFSQMTNLILTGTTYSCPHYFYYDKSKISKGAGSKVM